MSGPRTEAQRRLVDSQPSIWILRKIASEKNTIPSGEKRLQMIAAA